MTCCFSEPQKLDKIWAFYAQNLQMTIARYYYAELTRAKIKTIFPFSPFLTNFKPKNKNKKCQKEK